MTADKPRAIPRRHLIRALLGRDIPSDPAPAPEPERTAAAPQAAGRVSSSRSGARSAMAARLAAARLLDHSTGGRSSASSG